MLQSLIQIGLPVALILIMVGVGLGLTPEDFRRVFRQPRGFFIGALCQMALLPLIAIAIIEISGLHGEVAIGLFILSLCPGGTTSNLYSYLAKADTGLSVSLTAVIGFVTPFTIPLLTVWAINHYADGGTHFELPLVKTWLQLIVRLWGPQACAATPSPAVNGFRDLTTPGGQREVPVGRFHRVS